MSDEDKLPWRENCDDWELRDVIQFLVSRPKMFFRGDSFEPCAKFLEGFALGKGGSVSAELRQFGDWLSVKFYASHDAARNFAWPEHIDRFTPKGISKYVQLRQLFEEFQWEESHTQSDAVPGGTDE